jgi:hypothetical protein
MESSDLDKYKTETHSEEIDCIFDKEVEDIDDVVWENKDLLHELKMYFRLIRKKASCLIRETMQKNFTNIVYLTLDCPDFSLGSIRQDSPLEYITQIRSQYPDKNFVILTPIVGLDREFLESALPLASVAYGFFGIDSVDGKTMSITPELPAELTYWKMENLALNKVKYDLKIYGNAIQLSKVRGNVAGLNTTVALNYTEGQHVYVNGVEVTDFVVENGKAIVTVAFGATVVEVK